MHISIRRVHPMRLHILPGGDWRRWDLFSLSRSLSSFLLYNPSHAVSSCPRPSLSLSLSLSLSFFGASARSPGEETGKRGPLGRRFGQCDANCVSVRVTRWRPSSIIIYLRGPPSLLCRSPRSSSRWRRRPCVRCSRPAAATRYGTIWWASATVPGTRWTVCAAGCTITSITRSNPTLTSPTGWRSRRTPTTTRPCAPARTRPRPTGKPERPKW